MVRMILPRGGQKDIDIGRHWAESASSAASSRVRWVNVSRIVGRNPPRPA